MTKMLDVIRPGNPPGRDSHMASMADSSHAGSCHNLIFYNRLSAPDPSGHGLEEIAVL